jgi:hypothetical protein
VELYAAYLQRQQPVKRGRFRSDELTAQVRIDNPGESAWLEHAPHLLQCRERVSQMKEHRLSVGCIEGGVRKRELVDAARFELNVRNTALRSYCARCLDLARLDVNAHGLSGRDGLSEPDCYGTRAAATVEHTQAGAEVLEEECSSLIGCAPREIGVERRITRMHVSLASCKPTLTFNAWLTHSPLPFCAT